jgi:MioC protein
MAKFEIIVGSVLGASEYVADALQETLLTHDHKVEIHLTPDLSCLDPAATWIICTSTHGAGDLPDNIQPFAKQLQQHQFKHLAFIVIGLGDSSYDTFCYAAQTMQTMMQDGGATLLTPVKEIDVLHHPIPEDVAVKWLENWLQNADQNN